MDGYPLYATLLQVPLSGVFLDPRGKPAAISSVDPGVCFWIMTPSAARSADRCAMLPPA